MYSFITVLLSPLDGCRGNRPEADAVLQYVCSFFGHRVNALDFGSIFWCVVQSMTLAVMSFGSQLSNSIIGSSHDTSFRGLWGWVCSCQPFWVSWGSAVNVGPFFTKMGVFYVRSSLLQGYSIQKWNFSDVLYMTFFLQMRKSISVSPYAESVWDDYSWHHT